MAEEQFLAMLRFEGRSRLAKRPDEVVEGRDASSKALTCGGEARLGQDHRRNAR